MKIMIPGTEEYMTDAGYWTKKLTSGDRVIMSPQEITDFNSRGYDSRKVFCIEKMEEYISGSELTEVIKKYELPETPRYDIKGKEITKEFYKAVLKNRNLEGIKNKNRVMFAIAAKNARIRSFPVWEGVYKEPSDKEFDRFQETECQALELAAVLHTSLDGKWYFVRISTYEGWVSAEDMALAQDRKDALNYKASNRFIIVTGDRIWTQFNHYDSRVSDKSFYMGTVIPLSDDDSINLGNQSVSLHYRVKLAVRSSKGFLEFSDALISANQDVSCGYLPYTRNNIIKQSFKLLGDRYDWGNKNNGRDCSSYVMYVYKTFGIMLPRNADDQEKYEGISIKFKEDSSAEEKIDVFKNIFPGAALFMDGHVMLYIGEENGVPYMIHDFHRYGVMADGKVTPVYANEVAVTPTTLLGAGGNKFIDFFTSAMMYEI